MRPGITPRFLFSAIVCFGLFSCSLFGQSYNFRNYLPKAYVYSLAQDKNGFLWAGTGSGLFKFDGFDFSNIIFPDTVPNRIASAILKDRKGRMWIGGSDGTLFYTNNNDLIKIPDQGIQSINDIVEGEDGYVYIIPQDRMILKINENNPSDISRFFLPGDISMTTACILAKGGILLGTQENLLFCTLKNDSVSVNNIVSGIEYSKVQAIRPLKGKDWFLIGTESSGLYKLTFIAGKPLLKRFANHPELESVNIKSIFEDSDQNLWISDYGSGVLQLKLSSDGNQVDYLNKYTLASGLRGEEVKTFFQDIEGNMWIGFYGEGLSMLNSSAFTFYSPGEGIDNNNIIYICRENNSTLLFTPKGYYLFNLNTGKSESYVDLTRRLGQNEVSSYFHDTDNKLWIGTKGNGLYLKTQDGSIRLFKLSGNSGEDDIRNITCDRERIWLSTTDGVVILDKRNGNVLKKFKRSDRLPHNSINQIYLKSDGTGLVATECDSMRLYTIDIDKGVQQGLSAMYNGSKNKVLCYSINKNGETWAGTAGSGAYFFKGDTIISKTTANGLFSNFCYSILADSEGKVWIGHRLGFSRYDSKTGSVKVFSTDFAKGADCNPNALYEAPDGKVLIGTTEGLIVYNKEKEKKIENAPINNILSVTIDNIKYPWQPGYSLKYGKYDIVVDFVGINLSDPGKVYYSTKLEKWADNWSDWRLERETPYYQVRDGKYKFMVKSVNEDGITQEQPATFEIFIRKPYWRTWWFILSAIVLSAGTLYIIIRQREKAQNRIKEYLETELAERTRLVLKQKDEIELQNVEITDSINYAKRIQSSILPDINKLKESFKDAFIIFHPRDIVSGDFYWFDKVNDEKFIIVCADSTGHGVPGAFMSMIGSTLLQDIVARKGITKPSEILSLLDKQIFATLNQNVDVGVSNDGMDMVVCEFNTKTRHMKFASAMRPVIIVMGGESYYIKGNRCSVGGESVVEKYFDDQEYYLREGDTIYMFSDGLPDQFGGKDGKKMKIARLKKLLDEVSKLPMNEQKEDISSFFFDWKGDYEQVDDILLMGIRV